MAIQDLSLTQNADRPENGLEGLAQVYNDPKDKIACVIGVNLRDPHVNGTALHEYSMYGTTVTSLMIIYICLAKLFSLTANTALCMW